jgi:hypothetical protein
MDFLGSAAFSKAVQALDIKTGMLVCLKIIKVLLLLSTVPSVCPAFVSVYFAFVLPNLYVPPQRHA